MSAFRVREVHNCADVAENPATFHPQGSQSAGQGQRTVHNTLSHDACFLSCSTPTTTTTAECHAKPLLLLVGPPPRPRGAHLSIV